MRSGESSVAVEILTSPRMTTARSTTPVRHRAIAVPKMALAGEGVESEKRKVTNRNRTIIATASVTLRRAVMVVV